MADQFRRLTTKHPGDLPRQFKSLGNIGENGDEVYAEIVALEPLSIGGGGAGTPNYTEGDVDSTITGVAMMWEDASDTMRAISAGKPLPVNVVAGGGAGGLTDTQLRASPVPVSGTFWQATQPVSGPLTDTQLRASAVAVTGPLTDTQLRASAVPVSGPLTDTQLRATPVPVSQTGAITATLNQAYTEGDVDSTITGLALMWEDTSDTLRSVSAAKPLPVSGAFFQATQPVSVAAVVHVDDNAGSLTVDGTVTANAGTGPFPVSDNAGSLTVDAPVGTPVFVRLSDGAAAYKTNTDAQLPSALVGGRLDVNIGSPATLPVSLATNTPDVTDRAAREVGRVRLWDGTDEATVLPRDTDPTASDKGLVVIPMKSSRPGYQVVTTEITGATATGVKQILHLWHPAAVTKDVFILEIGVNMRVVQTAGTYGWELSFTSAIGTGGTTVTPQQLNNADAASGCEARVVQTGGGTLKGQIFQRATSPLPAAATPWTGGANGFVVFKAYDTDSYSDAIILRSGQAEGLNIQQNIIATLTTAPIFNVYVRYIERA